MPSVKHGGGNVMVCFGAGKVGDLYTVKGILNKEGYHSILQCKVQICAVSFMGMWNLSIKRYVGQMDQKIQ